jgi:hypothetical protein
VFTDTEAERFKVGMGGGEMEVVVVVTVVVGVVGICILDEGLEGGEEMLEDGLEPERGPVRFVW